MTLRRIVPMRFLDIEQIPVSSIMPSVSLVNPRDLVVDESYQRNLSQRSVKLIRNLIARWDWSKFKAPNVNKVGDELHVLDGQHTAIAAASRDDIHQIPVLIQDEISIEQRAAAFVGINRDRINITPNQLFLAEVAAGNAEAIQIKQTLEELGVTVLAQPRATYEPGDTMAISTIKRLYNKRHLRQWKLTVEVLARCNLAPISADFFKAIDELMWSKEYTDEVNTRLLISTIRKHSEAEWASLAYVLQTRQKIPGNKALKKVIYNEYIEAINSV